MVLPARAFVRYPALLLFLLPLANPLQHGPKNHIAALNLAFGGGGHILPLRHAQGKRTCCAGSQERRRRLG
eukprot:CAMPEP_0174940492 /NCGR_PEP_ID=MMETSP1355-20121228/69292_1 /TAXON_ID=464990 /ORGANISM="Hemiselmis tepida, Strain CCMP443" /LENGTH=70 /DNA_ID=CAMNT_0016187547 /DNA_START=73 /DNA_END=281 /DNA_ORIENTATION=-